MYDAQRGFHAAKVQMEACGGTDCQNRAHSGCPIRWRSPLPPLILVVFELLHHAEFPPAEKRFLLALAITAGFALLAWFAGGVNLTGALAGSAVAFIMAVRDLRMFLALLIVFAVTLAATRVGYARKQQLRTAEPAGGRTAAQAMANLGIAALIVAIAPEPDGRCWRLPHWLKLPRTLLPAKSAWPSPARPF